MSKSKQMNEHANKHSKNQTQDTHEENDTYIKGIHFSNMGKIESEVKLAADSSALVAFLACRKM